ncbi:MAG TPA: hypothetical protein PLJ35_11130 [Anaerolineae bacterium]|nr:hypothetical protein [Anaerolineae bacterium]HPL26798.1 hypothetical protein [Anaerolineae bacterium]
MSTKERSAFIDSDLAGALAKHLLANGSKVLGRGDRDAASQIEQAGRKRLEHNSVASSDERHPISLAQVEQAADCTRDCRLPPSSDSAGYHHETLHSADFGTIASHLPV